jgi:hypothetical protein
MGDGDEDTEGDLSVLEQEDGWIRYDLLYCETRIRRLEQVGQTIIVEHNHYQGHQVSPDSRAQGVQSTEDINGNASVRPCAVNGVPSPKTDHTIPSWDKYRIYFTVLSKILSKIRQYCLSEVTANTSGNI